VTADYGLGIDLGTTHTAAAVLVDGRVEPVRLGARRMEIPSAVFVKDDGGLLVGEAAERRGQDEPARLAREFKRRLGDPVPILVGGMPFSAQALTARLLRYVLDTVTAQQGGPPSRVALTCPAHWSAFKREQLDQAIRLADAGPVRLLSEPEAVARRHTGIRPGETVAVYDLGGSSFDVAVLRREGDSFTVLGTPEGVDQLGGADFDEAVYAHVLGALDGVDLDDPETAPALARLRRDCVEAKESLSFDTEVTVPVALPGRHTRVRISRSAFESLIALPLRDSVDATRRALRSAGVPAESLTGIVLAGGSSRIPLVAHVLGAEFGRPVVTDSHPELSVASGAAAFAGAGSFESTAKASSPGFPASSPSSDVESATAAEISGRESAAAEISGRESAVAEISGRESAAAVSNGGPRTQTAATEPAAVDEPGSTVRSPAEPVAQRSPAASRLGLSVRPPQKLDFTELRTPADPWAAVEAAEAEAARVAAEEVAARTAATEAAPFSPAGPVPFSPAGPAPFSPAGPAPFSPAGPAPFSPAGPAPVRPGTTVPISPAPGLGPGPDHEPSTQFIPGAHGTDPSHGTDPAYNTDPSHGTGPAYSTDPPYSTGTPYGAGVNAARRRRTLLIAGAAVLILAAAATGVVLADKFGDKPAEGSGTSPATSSAAVDPLALPTENLVVRVDSGGDMGSATWKTRIQVLNPVTGARTDLAGTEPGDTLPRWSNDRQSIALTHRAADKTNAIYVMNRDGSDRRLLVDDVSSGRVVWSSDDSEVAYVKKVGEVNQVFTIGVDGGEPTQLTSSDSAKDDPVWSTDGRSVIYWAQEGGVRSIFALDLAAPKEPGKRITKADLGDAVDPAISPDGTQILFTRRLGQENYDIWQIGVDGTGPKAVTNDEAREMDPTWSPNGEWFAYVRGDLNHPQVVVERQDGSGEQTLTTGDAREGHPCWF
jgi:molecular chaperone DnaK